jgi:hypothetical protein
VLDGLAVFMKPGKMKLDGLAHLGQEGVLGIG